MILNNKKIAIIGAGPVGLAMANLLQHKGIDVTVYERDKDPQARIWGGTLDLHENSGQVAMRRAGLLEVYFAMAKPIGRTIVDKEAHVLFTKEPQRDTPEINRNDLRKMLLGSLKSDTVAWDRKLTGLEQQNDKWLLHFENRIEANADFVIGANGGMSKVRAYITAAEIEYTGTFIIQGEVLQPEINCTRVYQLCNNNILMTASEGITLVAHPNNNGVLTYNVTFRKPQEWIDENGLNFQGTSATSAFLSAMFSDWHESYKQLFRSSSSFNALPSRKIPLEKPWKENRPLPITLIGDAAHIMPPFAGQGVNIGLMDAVILADNLTNGAFETVEAAIKDYEQKMLVYAKETQLETAKNEITMHQPDFSFKARFSN